MKYPWQKYKNIFNFHYFATDFLIFENIFWIILDIVGFQKSLVFFLEGLFAMVLFLIHHILFYILHLRGTDGEYGIAALPCEFGLIRVQCLDPLAAAFLDVFDEISYGDNTGEGAQDMYVVGNSADLDDHSVFIYDDAVDVGE